MQFSRLLALLGLAFAASSATASLGDELRALLEQGKSAEAYALVLQQPDRLGDPMVDFYFGVAATDSGHAAEGVLALERYVLNFPKNRAARLELARASFVVGDDQRAREEFAKAQADSTNDAEQATIDRFLEAIRHRESRYRPSFSAFAEWGLGIDSNVNGGVGSSSIFLPVLGQVTVVSSGVRKQNAFSSMALGAQGSYPVAPGIFLIGGLAGNGRVHDTASSVNQFAANAWGGVSFMQEKNSYSVTASYDDISLENDPYRKTTTLNGSVARQLDELQSVSLGVQFGEVNYEANNKLRDAEIQGIQFGWRKALIHPLQPVISLQGNWGKEMNQKNRPDLGREFVGFRAAMAVTPAARWGLSAGLSMTKSEYSAMDPTLATVRRDNYLTADLTAVYRVDRNWSVRGTAMKASNDSNLALYEYQRNIAEVKVRYDF